MSFFASLFQKQQNPRRESTTTNIEGDVDSVVNISHLSGDVYTSGPHELKAAVRLISASLDPGDSDYAERVINGRQVVKPFSKWSEDYHPYSFPTIDIKMQNVGTGTATLRQYKLIILESALDTRPELDFYAAADVRGHLIIRVKNDGWGPATHCHMRLICPTLALAFQAEAPTFSGEIPSGSNEVIIVVPPLSPEAFDALYAQLLREEAKALALAAANRNAELEEEWRAFHKKKQGKYNEETIEWLFDKQYSGWPGRNPVIRRTSGDYGIEKSIRLESLELQWQYSDLSGNQCAGSTPLTFEDRETVKIGGSFHLRQGGFYYQELVLVPCKAPSDETYSTIIEPNELPIQAELIKQSDLDFSTDIYEKLYPISRKIPPGDVERFHILVGATKSCRLRLKVVFFIDTDTVIETGEFEFHLLNRIGQQLHKLYSDGRELERKH